MKVEVARYRKPDGYLTRHWSVLVNGELLAVTLYRKGADAVAEIITKLVMNPDSEAPRHMQESPEGPKAESKTSPPPGLPESPPSEAMQLLPEPEAARRRRRRKGLLRKILGDAPF